MTSVFDRQFAAVLFDMDGTLVDSSAAIVRAWRQWGKEEGFGPSHLFTQHGVPARDIVASLVPAGRFDAAHSRIQALEESITDGVVALPGAKRALDALPDSRRAIVTSALPGLARIRLAAAGLAIPALLISAEDVANGKPDPEPYLAGAAALGFDPADCLVIEDAPPGIEAGRRAGCAVLALSTTHVAAELDADQVVPNLRVVTFRATDAGIRISPAVE